MIVPGVQLLNNQQVTKQMNTKESVETIPGSASDASSKTKYVILPVHDDDEGDSHPAYAILTVTPEMVKRYRRIVNYCEELSQPGLGLVHAQFLITRFNDIRFVETDDDRDFRKDIELEVVDKDPVPDGHVLCLDTWMRFITHGVVPRFTWQIHRSHFAYTTGSVEMAALEAVLK